MRLRLAALGSCVHLIGRLRFWLLVLPLLLGDRINALNRSSLGSLSRRLCLLKCYRCCGFHSQFGFFCLSTCLLDTPGVTAGVTIALRFCATGRRGLSGCITPAGVVGTVAASSREGW